MVDALTRWAIWTVAPDDLAQKNSPLFEQPDLPEILSGSTGTSLAASRVLSASVVLLSLTTLSINNTCMDHSHYVWCISCQFNQHVPECQNIYIFASPFEAFSLRYVLETSWLQISWLINSPYLPSRDSMSLVGLLPRRTRKLVKAMRHRLVMVLA